LIRVDELWFGGGLRHLKYGVKFAGRWFVLRK
jgi:hypothetical protein